MKPSDPAARHGIPPELLRFAVAIDSVHRWPGNPREHDIDKLRESLRKYGQPKPIVAQESSRNVFAGNGLLEAAEAEGWTHVAVTFRDWPDLTCREFLLDDNKTHDRGHDDFDRLATFLHDLHADGGSTVAFDQRELDKFLSSLSAPQAGDDDIPAAPAKPWVKRGELYELGEHRVMCGDSTDDADLARLFTRPAGCLLTDPPYGIDLDTDYSGPAAGRTYRRIIGDDKPFDAGIVARFFAGCGEQFWFGADYYRRTLPGADGDGSWLVWDKRVDEAKDAVIGAGFELLWSRQRHQRRLLRYDWTNWTSHTNGGLTREHPTEKPVALLMDILTRWAPPGEMVADPYAGAGSVLIAAERTGRAAHVMEIDPAYAQVIIERWQTISGAKAVLA